MKKLVALVLCLFLVFAICACNGKKEQKPAQTDNEIGSFSYKTVYELIEGVGGLDEYCMDTDYFSCLFTVNGITYRAEARSSQENFDKLFDIPFDDPDYDKKVQDIYGPLELTEIVNLTKDIMTEQELARFVGKTGQELMDEGFVLGSFDYGLDETSAYFWKGFYQYRFVVNGILEYDEDAEESELVKSLTFKSAEFSGYTCSE